MKLKSFQIGQRTVKTAISATLCALLYGLVGRNPTFACIGAIFGMGSDLSGSRLHGGNRLFGTIIGGLLGMALFRFYLIFYPEGEPSPLLLALLFIGVVALIAVSQMFWEGAVQPGGVVLCILLFNTLPHSYVSYALNRIVDTGIGVAVSLLINYLLPRHRVNALLSFLRGKLGRGREKS